MTMYLTPVERETRSLGNALLSPTSVALVGASNTPGKTTARPLQFMQESGFEGRIYPINPGRDTVMGLPAYASLKDLPEVPEFVFIMTGTDTVVDTVRECGEIGVTVACVLAGGFGEEGPAGLERQNELVRVAQESGVRLVGPNSIGIVNPRNGFMATANAAFGESNIPTGKVFVASQSGSVIGALMTRAKEVGLGFAGLVSTGSEVDLTLGEICESTLDDPGIESYALFLESLENAPALARFALLAAERGKGVSVLKLGRSDVAAQLSVSHTGALAGADDDADAFFKACGFVRVDVFEALIESTPLHKVISPSHRPGKPRVGVITSTGGGAAVLVDELEMRDVSVVKPSTAVFEALAQAEIDVSDNIIVDLTLAGTRHDKVVKALEILQESGEFDVVVFVIGSSARHNPELAVQGIADSVGGSTPVCAWAVPDALTSLKLLNDAGVPAFRTPESCANAIAAALLRKEPQRDPLQNFRRPEAQNLETETLDERTSGEVLSGVGVRVPRYWAGAKEALNVPSDAYPVVLKALSADLPHKSDAGAVILRIENESALWEACDQIIANVRNYDPRVNIDQFLVQEMVSGGVVETLIGYRVSEVVGPTVMLAAGGVNVEIYRDSSLRLAPVSREEAAAMVAEVKALELARGYRGAVHGDLEALTDEIVAVSQLALQQPDILEAEMNPVLVKAQGEGVIALDALVRRQTHPPLVVNGDTH